jgi:hypothetical protein
MFVLDVLGEELVEVEVVSSCYDILAWFLRPQVPYQEYLYSENVTLSITESMYERVWSVYTLTAHPLQHAKCSLASFWPSSFKPRGPHAAEARKHERSDTAFSKSASSCK